MKNFVKELIKQEPVAIIAVIIAFCSSDFLMQKFSHPKNEMSVAKEIRITKQFDFMTKETNWEILIPITFYNFDPEMYRVDEVQLIINNLNQNKADTLSMLGFWKIVDGGFNGNKYEKPNIDDSTKTDFGENITSRYSIYLPWESASKIPVEASSSVSKNINFRTKKTDIFHEGDELELTVKGSFTYAKNDILEYTSKVKIANKFIGSHTPYKVNFQQQE
ncbi:hypothetical protein [Flammeovirga sp. EKP202]|uniref:hypothetical protein n=1 Tax=Flammeovirga sp. EKP202 TaxID=2770592 RepID=UPI00165FD6D4|nr:hypothetical protein [Flammeovirga sp. EKP202]MBD0400841.1 hypothetical protein [Flammeovirga sp. EKP202]